MGNELFGVDIAGIVADNIGPGVLPVQISRKASTGERDPANLTGGLIKAPAGPWDCMGFWEDFSGLPPPGVEIELNDRKAVLIGDTIPAEALPLLRGDAITCEGRTLYMVKVLSRDPAAASYTLLCRDRSGPNGA